MAQTGRQIIYRRKPTIPLTTVSNDLTTEYIDAIYPMGADLIYSMLYMEVSEK